MRARVCSSVRRWAPLFALLTAGCGIPRFALGDLQLPTRTWETGQVLASGNRLYAADRNGSAILEIDPDTLRWTEPARVRRLAGFDVDDRGLWLLERLEDPGRLLLRHAGTADRKIEAGPDDQIHWTAEHLILWSAAGRICLVPKRGGPERFLESPPTLRLLGVDPRSETLWATRERRLLILRPDDPEWRPARLRLERSELTEKDLADGIEMLGFGRDRFAFLIGGLIYAGRPGPDELTVQGAIDLPGQVRRIAFNTREKDVLLAWTDQATWAWDLAGREGMRFSASTALYFDPRRRRAVRISNDALAFDPPDRSDGADRRLMLDELATSVNQVWRALTCAPDFALLLATSLTPAGLILNPLGLTTFPGAAGSSRPFFGRW